MLQIKTKRGEQTITAGSAISAYENRIELGLETKRVLGYYVLIIKTGGLIPESCQVTFSNASRTLFDPIGLGHLIVGRNLKIRDRFYEDEPFEVNGFLNVKTSISAVPATDFVIQYVLLVETT